VSKVALDNGVAEKLLDVMKQNGRALGDFVGAVLHDERLALTSEQMEAAKIVVQELMQNALTG
jgi:hypothetical protein